MPVLEQVLDNKGPRAQQVHLRKKEHSVSLDSASAPCPGRGMLAAARAPLTLTAGAHRDVREETLKANPGTSISERSQSQVLLSLK